MTIQQLTQTLTYALTSLYPPPEAQAIAALVVEHLMNLTPLQRQMRSAEPVPTEVLLQVTEVQRRLLAHEPVQYVLGVAHFAGMGLEVTPATLIPRPETEELLRLVETEQRGRPGLQVLDVGTGSGCLAIGLARALPGARVLGVDVSGAALEVARRNAARYAPAVAFAELDILTQTPALEPGTLDVLVSNPPYVRQSERALMRPNVRDYEPAQALFVPDDDPLVFYRRLAALGRALLRPGGGIYLEINEGLGAETRALLEEARYQVVEVRTDMFDRPRFVGGVVG